jgi:hypothetical protein
MPTFTAPKAYIKIDNKVAGYVRNLQFAEQISRANVQGLGSLLLQEVPPVGYQCTFTVDQFFLDFKQPVLEGMMHRLGSVKAIVDTLVLGELGFALAIYSKTIQSQDSNTKMVTSVDPTGQTMALLNPCFVNNQQFSLAEGGVAGYNISGIYLNPISTLEL